MQGTLVAAGALALGLVRVAWDSLTNAGDLLERTAEVCKELARESKDSCKKPEACESLAIHLPWLASGALAFLLVGCLGGCILGRCTHAPPAVHTAPLAERKESAPRRVPRGDGEFVRHAF